MSKQLTLDVRALFTDQKISKVIVRRICVAKEKPPAWPVDNYFW